MKISVMHFLNSSVFLETYHYSKLRLYEPWTVCYIPVKPFLGKYFASYTYFSRMSLDLYIGRILLHQAQHSLILLYVNDWHSMVTVEIP